MATVSCVVDMGKKKLEMGIEDQKISFELFDEERTRLDQNVWLEVKESKEKVLKERTKIDLGWQRLLRQANDVKRAFTGRQPNPF